MANICEYNIIVKGKRNACYAFYGSTSNLGGKAIDSWEGTDDYGTLKFHGDCKWAIDCYCSPFDGKKPVELPDDYCEAEEEGEDHYWYNTVQERSEMFQVEVQCVWADVEDYDDESGPDMIYEHYNNGEECPDNYSYEFPKELVLHGEWDEC